MTKLKALFAILVFLPLAALSANVTSEADLASIQLQPLNQGAELDQSAAITCCWVFAAGRWWCVPC